MASVIDIQTILAGRIIDGVHDSIGDIEGIIDDELEKQACINYQNLSKDEREMYRDNVGKMLSVKILRHPCMKNIIDGEVQAKDAPLTSQEMFDLLREIFPWDYS
ncbi:MAG: hypothetical protein K9N21_10430 [Deltaproteobacteria bacterium]|nr:hypothetical protein [Deltaproteobacteria bacterium]